MTEVDHNFTLKIGWKAGDNWPIKSVAKTAFGILTWTMTTDFATRKTQLKCDKIGSLLWSAKVVIEHSVTYRHDERTARSEKRHEAVFSDSSSEFEIENSFYEPKNLSGFEIELKVIVKEMEGIVAKRILVFDKPNERCNFKLKVGEKLFYVGKQLLIDNSKFFENLFRMAPEHPDQFELKNVHPGVMPTGLSILYNAHFEIKDETVDHLLNLGKTYKFPVIIEQCIEYLNYSNTEMREEKILELAAKYQLLEVEREALRGATMKFLNDLQPNEINDKSTWYAINQKRIELVEQAQAHQNALRPPIYQQYPQYQYQYPNGQQFVQQQLPPR